MSGTDSSGAETPVLTVREAINRALREALRRDERVFVFGEDVADYGGLYRVTDGLLAEFGRERVFDTPLAETAIAGSAVGAALAGARPVAEIMFGDFLAIVADHLINYAAKMHFNYGDDTGVPLVVRATYGAGDQFGLHHSQSPETWFQNVPGLTVVMPSTPADYHGLLTSAIRADDPVLFLEHKQRYDVRGPVPDGDHAVPLYETDRKREGGDVTVVALGGMVDVALDAAEDLAAAGVECEVIDPRTVVPLDVAPIVASVEKTNKLVTVHEAPLFGGFGGEIVAQVAEHSLFHLDAPVRRVGAPFTPVPFASNLEARYLPDADDVVAAVDEVVRREV